MISFFTKKKKLTQEEKDKMFFEATDRMVKGISGVMLEVSRSINSNIDAKFLALDHRTNAFEASLTNKIDAKLKAEYEPNYKSPVESYLTNLMYARDNFAETPHERSIFTLVINRIKQKHANSTT